MIQLIAEDEHERLDSRKVYGGMLQLPPGTERWIGVADDDAIRGLRSGNSTQKRSPGQTAAHIRKRFGR